MKKLSKKLSAVAAGVAITGATLAASPAQAGSDPFIGEIMATGYTFCPRGWEEAAGQLLPINSNMALFSLYGTNYGGDGRTTFGLPDLRGRTIIGQGAGPGLPATNIGQKRGGNQVTVNSAPSGQTVDATPTLTVRYCVAAQGIFPSRN